MPVEVQTQPAVRLGLLAPGVRVYRPHRWGQLHHHQQQARHRHTPQHWQRQAALALLMPLIALQLQPLMHY